METAGTASFAFPLFLFLSFTLTDIIVPSASLCMHPNYPTLSLSLPSPWEVQQIRTLLIQFRKSLLLPMGEQVVRS